MKRIATCVTSALLLSVLACTGVWAQATAQIVPSTAAMVALPNPATTRVGLRHRPLDAGSNAEIRGPR